MGIDVGHEQTVIAAGQKVAQVGGGLAFSSGIAKWIGDNHDLLAGAGVIVGIALGLAGFLVQYRYQKRRDLREQLFHDYRMRGE